MSRGCDDPLYMEQKSLVDLAWQFCLGSVHNSKTYSAKPRAIAAGTINYRDTIESLLRDLLFTLNNHVMACMDEEVSEDICMQAHSREAEVENFNVT